MPYVPESNYADLLGKVVWQEEELQRQQAEIERLREVLWAIRDDIENNDITGAHAIANTALARLKETSRAHEG